MSNFYSVVQYQNLPGETDFTVTFPFLRDTHVFVYRGENLLPRLQYTWLSPNVIRLNNGLVGDEVLTIRRFTFKDARLAKYNDGSILTSLELNEVTLQLLYLIQELHDFRVIGDGEEPIPGSPGDFDPGEFIQDIIDALEQTPIWATLTSLIPLVDLNAESVIRNALSVHENWKIDQQQFIDLDEFKVESGAEIVRVEDLIQEEAVARATAITALSASISENSAWIVTFEDAYADDQTAIATRFNLVEAEVSDNGAFVAEFRQAFVSEESAVATLVNEVEARLLTNELDNELESLAGGSSWIGGVVTRVSDAEGGLVAEGQRIDSLVSAVSVLDDDLNTVSQNVALAQTTADTAVTRTTALAEFAFVLGAATGLDPDNFNPATLAAAVEDRWSVYADDAAGVAKAEAISTIQAQSRPIFYSFNVVPTAVPGQVGFRSGWPEGFPDGSIWVRRFTYGGQNVTWTYKWQRGATSLNGLFGIDPTDPEPYAYLVTSSDSNLRGRWVNGDVQVVGALAQQMSSATIGPGSAAAILRGQVQAQVDGTVGAVQTSLLAEINEVENDVGELTTNVNLQYSMRMNVNLPDGPVVAGYGLGLAGTPEAGIRSDFIVMADHFSIVRPPTGDIVEGQFTGSPIVPFTVDSGSNTVHINGDLFISDNLFGYEGRLRQIVAGRIVLGDMTSDPPSITNGWNSLVNPSGFRLELTSSTDGFWGGTSGRNYLLWAGTGNTKNDNTAVFWVDEDGNAFFGGQVIAAGITGSLMDAIPIQYTAPSPTQAPSNGDYVTVGNAIIQANATTQRARRPFAIISVNMFGVGAKGGMARLQMRVGTAGDFGPWTTVSVHTVDMTTYANSLTLAGGMAATTGGDVQLRVQIREFDGQQPQSEGFSGVLLALPAGTSGQVLQDSPSGPDPGGSGTVPTLPNPDPGVPVTPGDEP